MDHYNNSHIVHCIGHRTQKNQTEINIPSPFEAAAMLAPFVHSNRIVSMLMGIHSLAAYLQLNVVEV